MRGVLRTVEITAALVVEDASGHNVHWRPKLQLSLDCFICQRIDRTTTFRLGVERAVCAGDSRMPEHYTAAAVTGFDETQRHDDLTLRTVVDYWWSPFDDEMRGVPGTGVLLSSWVRLFVGYRCPRQRESAEHTTQTNLTRPATEACRFCSTPLTRSDQAPHLRMLI